MKSVSYLLSRAIAQGPIFQYLAAFTGTLNIICSGLHYGWPSPTLPQLLGNNTEVPMTDNEGSWVVVMLTIGIGFGALLARVTVDRFGRKKMILFTSVPFFASWITIAFARTVGVLMAARFMAGISDGLIFSCVPMYVGEISNPNIRGLFSSTITVALMFGMLLINIIGSYLTITTTALACSALPVLVVLVFIWMPDSPYYLIMKGNIDQARKSLQIFKGTDDIEMDLNRLVEAVKEQTSNTGKYQDLFTVKSNRKGIFVIMGTRAAQQLSGVTAVNFYIQTVFKEGQDVVSPVMASIIYFTVNIIFSGISSVLVDKTGRRPLLISSITGTSVVLLIESCYFYIKNETDIDISSFSLIPIITRISFVVVFNVGMQTIPLVLASELFPTNIKASALSFQSLYFCVISTIIAKYFQFTKDEIGLHVPFFTFAVCCFLGLIFIIFYVPETKGKTLEEIQEELRGETVKKTVFELKESFKKIEKF